MRRVEVPRGRGHAAQATLLALRLPRGQPALRRGRPLPQGQGLQRGACAPAQPNGVVAAARLARGPRAARPAHRRGLRHDAAHLRRRRRGQGLRRHVGARHRRHRHRRPSGVAPALSGAPSQWRLLAPSGVAALHPSARPPGLPEAPRARLLTPDHPGALPRPPAHPRSHPRPHPHHSHPGRHGASRAGGHQGGAEQRAERGGAAPRPRGCGALLPTAPDGGSAPGGGGAGVRRRRGARGRRRRGNLQPCACLRTGGCNPMHGTGGCNPMHGTGGCNPMHGTGGCGPRVQCQRLRPCG